ncbi:MAG: hypothetical protein WBG62_16305, partial [Cyclobacteriaceae bacterium]
MEEQTFNIAPYTDEEVPGIAAKLAESKAFRGMFTYLFPDMNDEAFREKMNSLETVRDWQYDVVYPAVEGIASRSTLEITVNGFEHLEEGKA